jgi:5'-nucleotidase
MCSFYHNVILKSTIFSIGLQLNVAGHPIKKWEENAMSTQKLEITILHTNDMHSHLEAMSRLSAFSRRLKHELQAGGRKVFFFDAGDAADRRERFCSITKGAAFPRLLQAMGYDLQTLGNAISVTYGPQAASAMAQRYNFPVLAANFQEADGSLVAGFQATCSFPLSQTLRMRVIGLTPDMPDISALFGLKITDFISVTRQWLERLQAEGKGPIVVLSHLGLENDRRLAQSLPELDVIIGGHSHSLLPDGEWVDGVLVAQTGDYGRFLGRIDLLVDARDGVVLEKSAALIEIPGDAAADPAFEEALVEARQEGAQYLAQPIGELQAPLDLDYQAECGIGDLAADAVRLRMQAEACLLTGGMFHAGLPAGQVTLGDLDAACFSTANPQLSRVRGSQIRAALELALDPERIASKIKTFRGAPLGFPAVSGMQIVFDPQASAGNRLRRLLVGGEPLEENRLYRLAHTDAEVKTKEFPFGMLELEPGQVQQVELPTILPEVIADYLRAYSPVPRPAGGRLKIAKPNWWGET